MPIEIQIEIQNQRLDKSTEADLRMALKERIASGVDVDRDVEADLDLEDKDDLVPGRW